MDNFLIYAILAGVLIACSLSPMGSIILWRKIPYFGEAISHVAILGVVIGVALNINITVSIIIISIIFSIILIYFKHTKIQTILTVIISYSFLALGLFLLVFITHNNQVDIFSYLFGDILLVSTLEVKLIAGAAVFVLIWIYFRWKDMLLISINEDLAIVEGINTRKMEFEFLILVSFLIGISIKIIGTLLVGSMLIIPAATARNLSSSAIGMFIGSIVIGILSVLIGIGLSYTIDSSSGPSIVLSATAMFILSFLIHKTHA